MPDNCWFKVGFETRNWTVGETLIFDDTPEHEAMNDSDELRVVLIFDLWNPLLSDKDRKAASTLAAATRAYSMNESSSRLHSGTTVAPEKPTA